MTDPHNQNIENFDLIIFGGDGDLSFRKIFPALYFRLLEKQINQKSRILAIARTQMELSEYHKKLKGALLKNIEKADEKVIDKLLTMVNYSAVDVTEPATNVKAEQWFKDAPRKVRVFYLATPSAIFGAICAYVHKQGWINEDCRVVLEKPLGDSLASSEQTNNQVSSHFREDQIYRIDHYLGKETVQNLMVLRFANNIFERAWSAQDIDNIQITVAESLGVGTRGVYFNQYGTLRDMVQNHLLQLLCLIAMEPPVMLEADLVRDEKLKVLKALRPFTKETIGSFTAKGQYTRGTTKDGPTMSYLEEIGQFASNTETYVALKTYVDNWRWAGVPFYLRTGKRMPHRYSEIVINFKHVPHNLFPSRNKMVNNKLTIRLQPEERIELLQMVKIPGPGGYRYKPVSLELDYSDRFSQRFPEAYERLLMDVVRGNQTLFMRRDEVKASWVWIESILKNWELTKQPNVLYEAGTWGPGDHVMRGDHEWSRSKQFFGNPESSENDN